MPCWEIFDQQDAAYKESVLPAAVTARVSIEMGATLGWDRYVGPKGKMIGMHSFGASAPFEGPLAKIRFRSGLRRHGREATVGEGKLIMKVVIGSDHAGFQLKNAMGVCWLRSATKSSTSAPTNENPSDYPDFAEAVGKAVLDGRAETRRPHLAAVVSGASVAANKVRGIRAGMCTDTYSAHQGVEHDNINVLVLGSRITGEKLAEEELVRAYMGAKIHQRRTPRPPPRKVKALEDKMCQG